MQLNCNHYFINLETTGGSPRGYLHLYHKNYGDDKQVYFEFLFTDEIGTHRLMEEVNNSKFLAIHHNDFNESKDLVINDFITVKILRNTHSSEVLIELKDQTVRICSFKGGKELRREKKTLTYLIKTRYFGLANKTYDRYTPRIQAEIDLHRYRMLHKNDENLKEVVTFLERKALDCKEFSRVEYVHE